MPIIIPNQGNVPTPSGFEAQSYEGLVQLTWDYTPLATTYYISRSTDGITYSALAQTTALFYQDKSGTLNQIYYYYIQAATSLASSVATSAQTAQSLKPGQTTLASLRLQSQLRADLVNNPNIQDYEWNLMISQSYKELYDILVQKFGNDYFIQVPYSYVTTGQIDTTFGAQVFSLPKDFYKLMRAEVALNSADPNSWITLKKFEAIEANKFNYPNIYTMYGITNLRYRVWGNYLHIVPLAASGQTIRIWYAPRPSQLINDSDIVDGISGYEEYIIVDACIKAMVKQESLEQAQAFKIQKTDLMRRIEEAANNRDVGQPEVVSDVRSRNSIYGGVNDGTFRGGY